MLVVAETGCAVQGLSEACDKPGRPGSLVAMLTEPSQKRAVEALGVAVRYVSNVADLADEAFDDIVYFGANPETVEALNGKLAPAGLVNLVQGGKTLGRPVSVDVGRVHYGRTRWCGTTGANAAEGYAHIPATGEIRDGERIGIVGAAGPMGQMHVIRDVCTGRANVSLVATDFDSPRLDSLRAKIGDLAEQRGVKLRLVNPKDEPLTETFTYVALMAPIPALVAQAVADCQPGGIINIFAGIPAGTRAEIDLDAYLSKKLWMFGTSGSTIEDMKRVLDKVQTGRLDTNLSVDAVSGLAGAIDGIRAVENRTLAGKILVYPALRDVPLLPLEALADHYPSVAEKLDAGRWTQAAEEELLRVASSN